MPWRNKQNKHSHPKLLATRATIDTQQGFHCTTTCSSHASRKYKTCLSLLYVKKRKCHPSWFESKDWWYKTCKSLHEMSRMSRIPKKVTCLLEQWNKLIRIEHVTVRASTQSSHEFTGWATTSYLQSNYQPIDIKSVGGGFLVETTLDQICKARSHKEANC